MKQLLIFVLVLAARSALAQIYLSTSGNDANDGLSPDHPKLTINAAVGALPDGGTIYAGEGTFVAAATITDPNEIKIVGQGEETTIIQAPSNGDPLFSIVSSGSLTITHFTLTDLELLAASSGGDLITMGSSGKMSFAHFNRVFFRQQNASNHVVYASNTPNFTDNHMEDCTITGQSNHTVPLVQLISSNNGINTNTFNRIRATYSGNYVFWIENTGSAYAYDNTFRDINLEVANGGGIKILSGFNTIIENVAFYDLTTTTNDLIFIGKSSGLASKYTTIRNMGRRGGTLGTNLVDIRLQSVSAGITSIASADNATLTSFKIDLGLNSAVSINNVNTAVTLLNPASSAVRVASDGLHFGEDTALARSASGAMTINGAEIVTSSVETVGNANAALSAGTTSVLLTSSLTAARTYTLPRANTLPQGAAMRFADVAQTITLVNTVSFARGGGDTINGGTSNFTLATTGAVREFVTDGISKWTVQP